MRRIQRFRHSEAALWLKDASALGSIGAVVWAASLWAEIARVALAG